MAVHGRVPTLALVVEVTEAFMHCAKCVVRSHLWEPDDWPDPATVPNLATALIQQLQLSVTRETFEAGMNRDIHDNLY